MPAELEMPAEPEMPTELEMPAAPEMPAESEPQPNLAAYESDNESAGGIPSLPSADDDYSVPGDIQTEERDAEDVFNTELPDQGPPSVEQVNMVGYSTEICYLYL